MQDCLGSVSYWWPTVSAGDCGETAQLHEIEAGWNNTSKHLMGMVQGETLARAAVAMAAAVAGGAEELRRRPLMSDLIGTVSPLTHDKDGIEAGLVFAEAGIPVCYVTMPNLGTTAPATKAGAFVVGAAEIVAAVGAPRARLPRQPGHRLDHADLRRPAHGTHHDDAARRPLPLPRHRAACTASASRRWGRSAAPTPSSRAPGSPGVETMLQLMQLPLDGCELYTGIGLTEHLPAVHAREPHPRRRPLSPREARVPRHPHGRGVARARRDRRRSARAGTSSPSRTRGGTCGTPSLRAVSQEIGPDGQHYRDPVEVARERALDILDELPAGAAGRRRARLELARASSDALRDRRHGAGPTRVAATGSAGASGVREACGRRRTPRRRPRGTSR